MNGAWRVIGASGTNCGALACSIERNHEALQEGTGPRRIKGRNKKRLLARPGHAPPRKRIQRIGRRAECSINCPTIKSRSLPSPLLPRGEPARFFDPVRRTTGTMGKARGWKSAKGWNQIALSLANHLPPESQNENGIRAPIFPNLVIARALVLILPPPPSSSQFIVSWNDDRKWN